MEPKPREIIRAMRQARREQVFDRAIIGCSRETQDYIQDHKLMRETYWPAYVLSITDAGIEYIQEHSDPSND